VLFLATVGSLMWIGYLAKQANTDVREMVVWSVAAIFVAICYGVMALPLFSRTVGGLLRTLKSVSEKA
jgi:hypothetical protein